MTEAAVQLLLGFGEQPVYLTEDNSEATAELVREGFALLASLGHYPTHVCLTQAGKQKASEIMMNALMESP